MVKSKQCSSESLFVLQTVIVNLITSELVAIKNPLADQQTLRGVCLLDTHCILYGSSEWVLVTMQGTHVETHQKNCFQDEFQLLLMDFQPLDKFHLFFWTGNLEDKRLVFQSNTQNHRTSPLHLNNAAVLNRKRNVLFACSNLQRPDVTLYRLSSGMLHTRLRFIISTHERVSLSYFFFSLLKQSNAMEIRRAHCRGRTAFLTMQIGRQQRQFRRRQRR